jgi:hypothetical protein
VDKLLLVAFLSFMGGYLLRALMDGVINYGMIGKLVEEAGDAVLKLIGTAVYKISYVDQLCIKSIQLTSGKENAKRIRNELEAEFEEWKKSTIVGLKENYPQKYKWQLEINDWDEIMSRLTDIYKKEKLDNNVE